MYHVARHVANAAAGKAGRHITGPDYQPLASGAGIGLGT